MKLSAIKNHLLHVGSVAFRLEDGTAVPAHFHITEVGVITKDFIDCGGTVRHEQVANFQLWNAGDLDHRLEPAKLLGIIALSEKVLGIGDLDVEAEYQGTTIGRYDVGLDGDTFVLLAKHTACLASDKCGVPVKKQKLAMVELGVADKSCCTPGGGCC